ncbi:DNA ligase [Bradyrhizobium sp. CCGUVB23]|uniref:ATP-dependent DNA ligase n=1 Tax=Bradyrhizobium sp. CCGUVB23 TaxID=2949630 RepID=UPI0020B32599|nr:DNA ligase [Bradyrhizobium sp. CCGUVB23]MCP3459396.1 DNA ligase [Bradyrhizobium sp. CCGUVB23]
MTSACVRCHRNGGDWTKRYPAALNRQKHFVIDGEAMILGVDGISDFNALHFRKHDHEVQLYAFDNGSDWTKRYPWIAEAALKNRQTPFVIDGEAVVLGVNGISDFNAFHSRKHDHEVQLYAFAILAMGGDDLRELPLHYKSNLERFLARRPDGITVAPFERGEIGPDLFRAACRIGLEGLVSKHRDRPDGRCIG